jgi:hypothetical protein
MNLPAPAFFCALALSLPLLPSTQRATAAVDTDRLKTRDPLRKAVLNLREFGKAGLGGDDTPIFRRALAEASRQGRALEIPAMRTPYRTSPLYLRSNTTVLLDSGVTIRALPGFADGQKLLNVADASAVQIIGYGAVLKMNRVEYKSGQYRHCVSINGASLVSIKGLTCLDAGGNGVYVGGSEQNSFSDDVTLEDIRVENSLSAGLRVVSARNLTIRRSNFIGSHLLDKNGSQKVAGDKSPGIQLDPNAPGARLENVRFEDTATFHNEGEGIRVVLSRLNATSTPVSVSIMRHHDTAAGGSSFLGIDDPASGRAVGGYLLFEGCHSESAQEYGAVFSFWNSSGARASFRGLTVVDPNSGGSTMDNAAVAVKRGGGGHDPIGNVEFVRTTIRDTRGHPKLDYYFSFADYSDKGIQNVVFRDAIQLTGARHKQPLGLYQGEGIGEIKRADDPVVRALWQNAEKRESANSSHVR